MSDKRKSGEGAMKGWQTRRANDLSHADFCYLSRLFNERANLTWPRDQRINEWLKRGIARRALEGKE